MCGPTVTGNCAVETLPEASVAVQVTSVVPGGKTLPDGGTHRRLGDGSSPSLTFTT